MARQTGASLFDCLEAVGILLRGGAIQQKPDGRLYVAPNEEYTAARAPAS